LEITVGIFPHDGTRQDAYRMAKKEENNNFISSILPACHITSYQFYNIKTSIYISFGYTTAH